MGSLSRTAEPKAAPLQAKEGNTTKETNNCDTKKRKEKKRLHHGRVVSAKSWCPSSNSCNNPMFSWRRFLFFFLSHLKAAGPSHDPFSLLHRDDGPKRQPGAGQVL